MKPMVLHAARCLCLRCVSPEPCEPGEIRPRPALELVVCRRASRAFASACADGLAFFLLMGVCLGLYLMLPGAMEHEAARSVAHLAGRL